MEIEEIRKYKAVLERRLTDSVQRELHAFECATGMCPIAVNVKLITVRTLADKADRYLMSGVCVQLTDI